MRASLEWVIGIPRLHACDALKLCSHGYGLGHLSIWKKGNAIPFFLPLFPSVGCSCREEVELVPVRMMLPFTDLDEPADTASRKTSRESFTLLGSRGSNKLLPV